MRRTFILATIAFIAVHAESGDLAAQPTGKKLVHAVLAKENTTEPTSTFPSETRKIRALWKGNALKLGDVVGAVWIAEDVGAAALKDREITEATVVAYKPDDDGVFSLVRPKEGWPAGRYRFDIYVNNKLAESLSFTIEPGVTIETH